MWESTDVCSWNNDLFAIWIVRVVSGTQEANLLWFFRVQAIHITQNGAPSEKLELAFKLYDIDNNGKIECNEMAEIIRVCD